MITKLLKRRPQCKKEKPDHKFSLDKNRLDGLSCWCRDCTNKYNREYHKKRKSINQNYRREYKYGMLPGEFERKEKEQDKKCEICKCIPEGKLLIDHCHKTNKNRDLLCRKCNALLGMVNDNSELLKAAIKYLEKHDSNNTTPSRQISYSS